jgi:hypothetical protein
VDADLLGSDLAPASERVEHEERTAPRQPHHTSLERHALTAHFDAAAGKDVALGPRFAEDGASLLLPAVVPCGYPVQPGGEQRGPVHLVAEHVGQGRREVRGGTERISKRGSADVGVHADAEDHVIDGRATHAAVDQRPGHLLATPTGTSDARSWARDATRGRHRRAR